MLETYLKLYKIVPVLFENNLIICKRIQQMFKQRY